MAYYTYIIKSEKADNYYTGYSKNPHERLLSKNTKHRNTPWHIVYMERFEDKPSAIRRKTEITGIKNLRFVKELIHPGSYQHVQYNGVPSNLKKKKLSSLIEEALI